MPIDINSLFVNDMPHRDSNQLQICNRWCPRCYYNEEYTDSSQPIWGVGTSAFYGRMVHEVVAMQGNSPYIELWRMHYVSLVDKLKENKIDCLDFPAANVLKRKIEILAKKNNYPPYSLVHIVAWSAGPVGMEKSEYAIFQSRLPESVFRSDKAAAYLMKGDTRFPICTGGYDNFGINRFFEHIAASQAALMRFGDKDCSGACLVDSEGRIVRTTLGNIYLVYAGARVFGVSFSHGAKQDVLCPYIEEILSGFKLPFQFERVDGFTDSFVNEASECFICDPSVGVLPVMSVGTTKRFRSTVSYQVASAMKDRLDFI